MMPLVASGDPVAMTTPRGAATVTFGDRSIELRPLTPGVSCIESNLSLVLSEKYQTGVGLGEP
jgi:hypothetical protein